MHLLPNDNMAVAMAVTLLLVLLYLAYSEAQASVSGASTKLGGWVSDWVVENAIISMG